MILNDTENDSEVKEQYQVKISNSSAPLKNVDCGGGGGDVDINNVWEDIIRERI
jgi:hypothetical protein